MDLVKLANDIWQRFSKLSDEDLIEWLKNCSNEDITVIETKNLNQYWESLYHNNYVKFVNDLKEYLDTLGDLDTNKKWIVVYKQDKLLSSTNNLAREAILTCHLLQDVKNPRMISKLGYTDKEIAIITRKLNNIPNAKINEAWSHVMWIGFENDDEDDDDDE